MRAAAAFARQALWSHGTEHADVCGQAIQLGCNVGVMPAGNWGAAMGEQRVYKASDHMQVSDGDPIRSVVVESEHSVIVAWHVEPGQSIAAHTHPAGQDTWTILSGEGQYQVDAMGNTVAVVPGDVVVARQGQVHGVRCTSLEPLRFISVVAPLEAGYVPLLAGQ